MPFGWTTKYGTRVPSLEVAQYCSTTSFEASNRGGRLFSFSGPPETASASHWVEGVRKLVTLRISRLSRSEAEAMPIELSFGRSRLVGVQAWPSRAKAITWPLTLS